MARSVAEIMQLEAEINDEKEKIAKEAAKTMRECLETLKYLHIPIQDCSNSDYRIDDIWYNEEDKVLVFETTECYFS